MFLLSLTHDEIPVWLTLLHSERPKLNTILAFLSAIGLRGHLILQGRQLHNTTVFASLATGATL